MILNDDWDREEDYINETNLSNELNSARNYLEMLENQKDELKDKLDSIDTTKYDDKFYSKSIPRIEYSTTKPQSSTFFNTIQGLENLVEELKTQYESEQKIQSELKHQKSILQQKQQKLMNSLKVYKASLISEANRARTNYDSLQHTENQLDNVNNDHEEEVQNCEELKNDLINITKEVQDQTRRSLNGIEKRIQELQDILDAKKFTEMQLQEELDKVSFKYKKEEEKQVNDIKKAKDVQYMQNSRLYLSKQNRMLDDKLRILRNDIITAESREKSVNEMFKQLFPNDDGTGSCEDIRALIQGKIDVVGMNTPIDLFEDLQAETDYEEDLRKQLETLSNTIKVLKETHEVTKKSLLNELGGCHEDGYVMLLQKEMQEIQAKAAQL